MFSLLRHPKAPSGQSRTVRFEGQAYDSQVSFFLVDNDPGQGPGLHVHPYPETWVVRKGEAEFTVGDQTVLTGPGDILVAPADVPHRFVNVGSGRLELVCIHPSDTIVQQWL